MCIMYITLTSAVAPKVWAQILKKITVVVIDNSQDSKQCDINGIYTLD